MSNKLSERGAAIFWKHRPMVGSWREGTLRQAALMSSARIGWCNRTVRYDHDTAAWMRSYNSTMTRQQQRKRGDQPMVIEQ